MNRPVRCAGGARNCDEARSSFWSAMFIATDATGSAKLQRSGMAQGRWGRCFGVSGSGFESCSLGTGGMQKPFILKRRFKPRNTGKGQWRPGAGMRHLGCLRVIFFSALLGGAGCQQISAACSVCPVFVPFRQMADLADLWPITPSVRPGAYRTVLAFLPPTPEFWFA